MTKFLTLDQIEDSIRIKLHTELSEIFFLSSQITEFTSVIKKNEFFERWLGFYLANFQNTTWCALTDEGRALGYLTVCPDTKKFLESFPLESLKLFNKFYKSYPAHLHMNTHPDARGMGIGGRLLELAKKQLLNMDCPGLHLITGAHERNVAFYERNGLSRLDCQKFGSAEFLLLGIDLSV